MDKFSIIVKFLNCISSCAWHIFLWASRMTENEYVNMIVEENTSRESQELEWLTENLVPLTNMYENRWIAICRKRVVVDALNVPQLLNKIEGLDKPFVTFLPSIPQQLLCEQSDLQNKFDELLKLSQVFVQISDSTQTFRVNDKSGVILARRADYLEARARLLSFIQELPPYADSL